MGVGKFQREAKECLDLLKKELKRIQKGLSPYIERIEKKKKLKKIVTYLDGKIYILNNYTNKNDNEANGLKAIYEFKKWELERRYWLINSAYDLYTLYGRIDLTFEMGLMEMQTILKDLYCGYWVLTDEEIKIAIECYNKNKGL